MSAQIIGLIMSWCMGAKSLNAVPVNGPTPEIQCRLKLIKCVDDNSNSPPNTIPADCLKDSLKW